MKLRSETLKSAVRSMADRVGVRILGKGHYLFLDHDMEPEFKTIYRHCQPFTLTTQERMYGLYGAVRHVLAAGIPGAFVECGVWRGGSMMLVAETLRAAGVQDRDLYLYDTFKGMNKATDKDVKFDGTPYSKWYHFREGQDYADASGLGSHLAVSVEQVRNNLSHTGYPVERMRFVEGKVEETIPATMPSQIAILRLDTDWYESTYHELVHLYPLLAPGGVLIIDDYGHWQGAREAVDTYFAEQNVHLFFHRVDYSCRIAIKPAG